MRFSVIIPLYNKAPYVAKTLQSVFDQTFTDWELIVVNDGSTDDSLQVATKIIEEVSGDFAAEKLNIISQNNSGVSTARNNGVAASHGEYICFLDADDWWETAFLEEMDKLIKDFPDAGIYGTGYYLVKNGINRKAPIFFGEDFERGYINYFKVYSGGLCMPLTSISVAMPRYVFDSLGGFKPHLRIGEDFDLWIRVALEYKVAFVNKSLAYYNQDVLLEKRALDGTLHSKDVDFVFNTDWLSDYEKENHDLKYLLDKQRATVLGQYYFNKTRRQDAEHELEKVDWSKFTLSQKVWYKIPYPIAKFVYGTRRKLYAIYKALKKK